MADAKSRFKRPEQSTPPLVSPEAEQFVHGTSPASAGSPRDSVVEPTTTDQVEKPAVAVTTSPEPPAKPVAMKRLTIDIPESLHRRVKSKCGDQGTTIADVVRAFLERKFPEAKP